MGIIYSKCHNGVIRVPGFADDTSSGFQMLVPGVQDSRRAGLF